LADNFDSDEHDISPDGNDFPIIKIKTYLTTFNYKICTFNSVAIISPNLTFGGICDIENFGFHPMHFNRINDEK